MRILIAVPIFNERKYVSDVLAHIYSYHPDVLAIDDGSSDGTAEILQKLRDDGKIALITHKPNQGYGQSLIDAFDYADRNGYDWVITMDCDEQHEPQMIPVFISEIEKDDADIISGSRYLSPRQNDDLPPGDRRMINATITKMLDDLLGLKLTDSFCGYKAHRVSAMRRLNLTEKGYAFPLQLWPQVTKAELKVREIPVRRIYNDPNRYFGGQLDDASNRLNHYLTVLRRELIVPAGANEECCSSCCCG